MHFSEYMEWISIWTRRGLYIGRGLDFIHWTQILDAERVNGKETDKEIAAYDLLLLVGFGL